MLLDPSPDQEFFRDTTSRFLTDRVPVAEIRRLRHDPAGFGAEYWRSGAELGWTSLLAGDATGGGSIGDYGLVDLTLVAYEFGTHAAPGPLVPTNVVADLLSRHAEAHGDVLASLVEGTATAAWCFEEPRAGGKVASDGVEITVDGDEVVVRGTKRPVEAAVSADFLLVTGRSGDGLSHVLVPREAPGVRIVPLKSIDITRRYAAYYFEGPGEAGASPEATVAPSSYLKLSAAGVEYARQAKPCLSWSSIATAHITRDKRFNSSLR